MLSVCTYFWHDPTGLNFRGRPAYQYVADDVRIWDAMVKRHLTIPHRRICITDVPEEIDFMETAPLIRLNTNGTCLSKLMSWRPDVEPILGPRFLIMDLDCIIVDNFDDIAGRTEDVVLWKHPMYVKGRARPYYQGSLQLLNAGARPYVWTDMEDMMAKHHPQMIGKALNERFGGMEQAWISERLNTAWPERGWEWDEAEWTTADGVYGIGSIMVGRGQEVGYTWPHQTTLPDNAKIVFTPGARAPRQAALQAQHPWIKDHYYA